MRQNTSVTQSRHKNFAQKFLFSNNQRNINRWDLYLVYTEGWLFVVRWQLVQNQSALSCNYSTTFVLFPWHFSRIFLRNLYCMIYVINSGIFLYKINQNYSFTISKDLSHHFFCWLADFTFSRRDLAFSPLVSFSVTMVSSIIIGLVPHNFNRYLRIRLVLILCIPNDYGGFG